MKIEDLEYSNLGAVLAPYIKKGLPESAAFLDWFLENIFRLDDVQAQDSICDTSNDKGVDGIYVDDFSEEIVFFQSKIGAVAELVGIEVGVVSGVINLESSGVEASDWRPRHDEHYHEV